MPSTRIARAARWAATACSCSSTRPTDTRLQDHDRIWVQQIKSALMENRFRLVQQPIASLHGRRPGMFDVLVRMLDRQGQEVLPAVFMAAAERNDLHEEHRPLGDRRVDVVLRGTQARRPVRAPVAGHACRTPRFRDGSRSNSRRSRIEPARIVFQIREEAAAQQIKEAVALHKALSDRGFRFALEGFGMGRDTEQLLNHLKPSTS